MNKEGIMGDYRKGTWEDVTDDCVVSMAHNSGGLCAFVQHQGHRIAWLGTRLNVEDKNDPRYRVTECLSTVESGGIKVELFIPDPEPVIAYKTVIEVDGEWVSTFAGSLRGGPFDELTYRIGETTTSTRGTGIHCADTLKVAKRNYPPANSDDRREGFDRKDGRVVILKVEGIGAKGEASCMTYRESVVFPSVKVLSVAWEEEKKEEWVNVTGECKVRTYNFPTLGSWFALEHKGSAVAHLGAETKILTRDNYRITLDDFGKGNNDHPGHIKVEKRND